MRSKTVFSSIKVALAAFVAAVLLTAAHMAAQETVLVNFDGYTSGCEPGANLILDAAGNLYGTSPCGSIYHDGLIFELSPQAGGGWTEEVLHSFMTNGHDGLNPQGGLIFDAVGNLYGVTSGGGTHKGGTVFELVPGSDGWTEYILHNFGTGTDGSEPNAGLVMDAAGNLYGTTTLGGVHGDGTVFELVPVTGHGWTEKVLHSFSGATDGTQPWSGLTLDAAGNLYGTTSGGGAYNGGTVFELMSQAGGKWAGKVLFSFGHVNSNGVSIDTPYAGVIFDPSGNLYGTAYYGGANGGGVVYKLSPTTSGPWKETPLYGFGQGTLIDGGYYPYAGVVIDAAGNLYGTTEYGGGVNVNNSGVVYELSPSTGGSWTETVLFAFNYTDGGHPTGSLIFDAAGNLYGTTTAGGTGVFGTVFEVAH